MKKVLFIDGRSGGDWGMDLLFAGLVQNLSYEGVIDYPPQDKHRMGSPALTGEKEKDWGAERRSLSYARGYGLLDRYDLPQIHEELRAGNVEVVFVDEREESRELYYQTRAHVYGVPVVVVAGHDRFWNTSPQEVKRRYVHLKRMYLDNWRPEYHDLPWARPYNWSVNFDHLWTRPEIPPRKVHDISFIGYNSHPDRARFVDHIEKKWSGLNLNIVLEREPNNFQKFVDKQRYFTTMLESKICLNLRGAAENGKTLRFYEIPYVGSCMLTQDSGAYQIDQLRQGEHCCYFWDEKSLDDWIEKLLSDVNLRENIALQGRRFVMENHTAKVRVAKMLEEIRGSR